MKGIGKVLRAKAPFMVGGLLVGVLALELVLQALGAGIGMRQKQAFFVAEGGGDPYKILTIGDSFTWAGDLPLSETYPYRLAQLLHEEQGVDVELINLGLCEINSWQASQRLAEHIDDHSPDLVLALSGATDKFNLFGTHIDSAIRDNTPIHDFFSKLKVYKLSKILAMGLKHRLSVLFFQSKQEDGSSHDSGFTDAYAALQDGERLAAEGDYVEAVKQHMASYERLYQESSDAQFSGLRDDFGASSFELFEQIFFGAMMIYWKRNRFDDALHFNLKALEDFPFYFSELAIYRRDDPTGADNLFAGFYFLSRAFVYQDLRKAQDVIDVFDRIYAKHPELAKSEAYQAYYAWFQDADSFGQKIDETRRRNLSAMAELCKARGVPLVLLDYPSDYLTTNRSIAAIAEAHDLLLVKSHPHFQQLIAEGGRAKYLEDDDHCTVLGYKVLGEHVHRELVGAGVFEVAPKQP